jgi:hypothetical protein
LFNGNLHTTILKRWEKDLLCSYRKDCGSKLYLFSCKNYSFLGLLFSAFFGLWSVIHSNRTRYMFSWTVNVTSQGVIFTVPKICAYFADNPHNLDIDSFKIVLSEHILLYFKNSNRFVLCTHDNVRHTLCMLCVISWCTFAFDR